MSTPDPPRKPNSFEVARLAGVSRSTVSFVLNNRTSVAIPEVTRARVLRAARDLNYRPNPLARALVTGGTCLIGVGTWDIPSPWDSTFLRHALATIRAGGYQSLVFETSAATEAGVFPNSGNWPIDGMLAEGNPEYVEAYLEDRINPPPIVTVGAEYSPLTDYVAFDINAGISAAIDHLIGGGRSRIAMVAPNDLGRKKSRENAFLSSIHARGGTPELLLYDYGSRTDIAAAVGRYIDANGCPDGLFCYNDEVAIIVNRLLRDKGIGVPSDVALVGCDGWIETAYQEPRISTIELPFQEGCQMAWQFLQRRMAQPSLPLQQATLPVQLVVRESSTGKRD